MQEVQKMGGNIVVLGFHLNVAAIVGKMIPVKQHGWERGQKLVGNIAGAMYRVIFFFW